MTLQILALDTTHEFGSLALWRDGAVVEEVLLHSPDGFGHVLFGQIETLLARREANVFDIDCFAAASGPGSFTGLRVGLAAVKGLAEATGRQAAGVSNLQALAWHGAAPLRAVVLDARRGEIYGAVYNEGLECVQAETVGPFPQWLKSLPEGPIEFIAADFSPFRPALDGTRFANTPVVEAPRALAAAVAHIAAARLAAGGSMAPEAVDANYVRRSDAELFWKDPK